MAIFYGLLFDALQKNIARKEYIVPHKYDNDAIWE